MPTIFDLEESNLSAESKHLKLSVSVPRKSTTKRVYQQDQFKLFEEYDAKLPKLYQIRGRADVQYSRRAQRARIQEKKNIIVQCYSIFTSSTLQFFYKHTDY